MLDSFDYELPPDRIAAWPDEARSGNRASSRLLVAGAETISDSTFDHLPEFLNAGDLLVFNNSRVRKRRLFARHLRSGREIELFVFREEGSGICEALAKPARRLRAGDSIEFNSGSKATIRGRGEGGESVVFQLQAPEVGNLTVVSAILDEAGVMPIPPYIRQGRAEGKDEAYYQNVYATESGSVAAPTAGLHFSEELLERLQTRRIDVGFVTLHVGLWSILPNRNADAEADSVVGAEQFIFPISLHQKIVATKLDARRVIAVGTTSCRVLETVYRDIQPKADAAIATMADRLLDTTLAIGPGHKFQVVDALITNFHQPRSTHLSVVSALMGKDRMSGIYEHALEREYMFLSYGDGMLLDPHSAAMAAERPAEIKQ